MKDIKIFRYLKKRRYRYRRCISKIEDQEISMRLQTYLNVKSMFKYSYIIQILNKYLLCRENHNLLCRVLRGYLSHLFLLYPPNLKKLIAIHRALTVYRFLLN